MGPVTAKFVGQVRGARTVMSSVQVDAVTDATKVVKPVMEAAVASMTGGDMALSNVKVNGAPAGRITVGVQIRQTSGAKAEATISGAGPLPLIESGAGSHDIAPRRSRRGRRRPAAIYGSGYDHPTSQPVRHPGFRGKGRWGKARDDQAPPVAREAYVGRNITAFRKAFQ